APSAAGASRCRLDLGTASIPALVLTFAAPASYTGEDAAEIQLPGNPDLLARALDALCARDGVRPANPGEFTARAHLNGRLTIEQAEGVAALIAAQDEAQRRAAEDLLTGATGDRYRDLADDVAQTLALVEAGIDFTDQEDVVAIEPAELRRRLAASLGVIGTLLGPRRSESPHEAPDIVLAGAPNAGKSTLFNALLGRPRAIISETPGATRDALREPIDLGGVRATLIDLAGLDEALAGRSPLDDNAQRSARSAIAAAQVVVVCDPAGVFDLAGLAGPDAVTLRVRTKADLPGAAPDDITEALAVCALDGWNLGALRRAIADACERSHGDHSGAVIPRHRAALRLAGSGIDRALRIAGASPRAGRVRDEELIADALRGALDALGAITGAVEPDDVLGRIFSSFCIGK
ncbi:MAG: 50S ribosome-binding GTPase, partial [Phycisphaeraceae bacterium]|nr:50S ribosome-binding GTPase [Phycisphaeraceae bacterium]